MCALVKYDKHVMEMLKSTLLTLFEENPLVTGGFCSSRASNTVFDVSLNTLLNKQLSCWWVLQPYFLRNVTVIISHYHWDLLC